MTDTDTTALRELLAKSDTMLTTLQVVLADAAPGLLDEVEALRLHRESANAQCRELGKEVEALRAENERLREALADVEVAGPDKDGLVWLQSRRGFMFNLGRAESLATANAVHWDEIRRAALEGKA